jgi:hypothetical protein
MKRFLLILLIINFIILNTYGNDFEKGNLDLSFSGSLSFCLNDSGVDELSLRIYPGIGVFIINNLELSNSLGIRTDFDLNGGSNYTSILYKPCFYYYFSKLKINPFISLGGTLDYFDYDNVWFGLNSSMGVLIPLKNNFYFRIEMLYTGYLKYNVHYFNLFFGFSKFFIIN